MHEFGNSFAKCRLRGLHSKRTCLGVCSAPTSLTLQSEKRASYIFTDIDLKRDQADIIATCRLYLDSDNGWIEDARECGRLRHLLHAKIPAI